MPKILLGNEWYLPVSSQALYENDFERILFSHSSQLFPDYELVPFKVPVASEHGTAKPDFALVDKQYRQWWVCETELAHHSREHVMSQVACLRDGVYNDVHARSLFRNREDLNLNGLITMMKGVSPQVLVVVNSPTPNWRHDLENLQNCVLMIVEIFRSKTDRIILRTNGEYPAPIDRHVLTTCRCDDVLMRNVVLDSPGVFAANMGETIEILFEQATTEWTLFQVGNRAWLSPKRSNPLVPKQKYRIVEMSSGGLGFESTN